MAVGLSRVSREAINLISLVEVIQANISLVVLVLHFGSIKRIIIGEKNDKFSLFPL